MQVSVDFLKTHFDLSPPLSTAMNSLRTVLSMAIMSRAGDEFGVLDLCCEA